MELQTEKRFHSLTLEQVQALDKVLKEIIPIHGRGHFPTLQVRAKDIIRVVKDGLEERDIQVKDIRLNGATASHVLVSNNSLEYRDLDIIFRVELPRQEDFQVIKDVVLGSLQDLLPCGVNRQKITCLTMKEAYVQKMVKVFNEHDRWSLISLSSNSRAKSVGLRFVSSLRRQFEFSVDSFQIILDRMLESYWETERKDLSQREEDDNKEQQQASPHVQEEESTSHCSEETETEPESGDIGQEEVDVVFELCDKSTASAETLFTEDQTEICDSQDSIETSPPQDQSEAENTSELQDSQQECSFPPPAKKTCITSQEVVPDCCPSPKLQRKTSRKMNSKPEKWSLLTDLSDLTTQLFPPIEIPKPLQSKPPLDSGQVHSSEGKDVLTLPTVTESKETVKAKHLETRPHSETQTHAATQPEVDEPPITVEAECMYGDFEQAMEHLRHGLIATHSPEEIRGGGLLKYSDLLVRNFRAASETQIKSLERYMCSRFFIDFPDVGEQQRKVEAYLQHHFMGNEETSKYDYLMTLRRVIDESTVCLMGHERRQTLNMITVLALRVLGEQNAIPNTANVTCFYQPAAYMTEPIYSSYFITQAQPPLVYHPYPLHVHM